MLCVTSVLKTPPTRVGKIGKNVTLPRTVPLASLIGGGAGAFFGAVFVSGVVGVTLNSMLWGAVTGGGLVLFLMNYEPVAGETFMKWIGLQATSLGGGRVMWKGERVRMAIGVAPITKVARGRVRMVGAAVPVNPTNFDERGALITESAAPSAFDPEVPNTLTSVGGAPVQSLATSESEDRPKLKRRVPPLRRPGSSD